MAERLEEVIAQCHAELFPEKAAGRPADAGSLKLVEMGFTEFVTAQICLPIITGLFSTWLYEKWKSIRSKEQAAEAVKEVEAYLEKKPKPDGVEREALIRHVSDLLRANGFRPDETDKLAGHLIEKVQKSLGGLV
jgi:hypothetical protein